MVGTYRFNVRDVGATGNVVGIVLYVWDWIHVLDGTSVKYSITSTGHALFFFGTKWRADHHGHSARLAVPSHRMSSKSDLVMAKRSGATPLGCRLQVGGRLLCGCDA